MDEMLQAQKSSWEEKEKLSKQLEEERHNNVNAAIGQVTAPHDCPPWFPPAPLWVRSCDSPVGTDETVSSGVTQILQGVIHGFR